MIEQPGPKTFPAEVLGSCMNGVGVSTWRHHSMDELGR